MFKMFRFCSCTAWPVSDLVRNPEYRFSHDRAHMDLECCLSGLCPEDLSITIEFLNFRTPENFAVIYLKFKQKA